MSLPKTLYSGNIFWAICLYKRAVCLHKRALYSESVFSAIRLYTRALSPLQFELLRIDFQNLSLFCRDLHTAQNRFSECRALLWRHIGLFCGDIPLYKRVLSRQEFVLACNETTTHTHTWALNCMCTLSTAPTHCLMQGERGALETLIVNTAHELQFASFNSLEEVVEKEVCVCLCVCMCVCVCAHLCVCVNVHACVRSLENADLCWSKSRFWYGLQNGTNPKSKKDLPSKSTHRDQCIVEGGEYA